MKQFDFLPSLKKVFLPFWLSLFLSTFFIAANAQAPAHSLFLLAGMKAQRARFQLPERGLLPILPLRRAR